MDEETRRLVSRLDSIASVPNDSTPRSLTREQRARAALEKALRRGRYSESRIGEVLEAFDAKPEKFIHYPPLNMLPNRRMLFWCGMFGFIALSMGLFLLSALCWGAIAAQWSWHVVSFCVKRNLMLGIWKVSDLWRWSRHASRN